MTNLADAEKITVIQPTGLLILCHSLSVEECAKALSMAHSRQPEMRNLVLTAATPVCKLGQNDELMSSFDGPKALIATANRLVRSNSARRTLGPSALRPKLNRSDRPRLC